MHLDDVLTELVEQSGDRLLRVAYQLTHDAAAAQDLVQEALPCSAAGGDGAQPRQPGIRGHAAAGCGVSAEEEQT
jgi:DNA-directed RNA polymerase specialized sigma24 family protein